MEPFDILCDEALRFLDEEAGASGMAHPGYLLRLLICPFFLDGLKYASWMQEVKEYGFFPMPDLFDPQSNTRRSSLASVARAILVSEPEAECLLGDFLRTEAAIQCGISREMLFPEREHECTLH